MHDDALDDTKVWLQKPRMLPLDTCVSELLFVRQIKFAFSSV